MPKPKERRKVTVELTRVLWNTRGFVGFKGKIVDGAKPEANGRLLTCKGRCPELMEGAHYCLEGWAVWDEKFNEYQMEFEKYSVEQTATATGLQNYLAKECEHLGPGRADQIVKLYGDQAWHVMLEEPIKLAQDIVGVNIFIAQEIQAWAKQEIEIAPVKKKLYEVGLTPGLIRRLIDEHGTQTANIIAHNAFSLTEIKGIGFLTADKVALKFGMAPTNPLRVQAAVEYALEEICEDQGHVCVRHDILINHAVKLLGIHKEHVIKAIQAMQQREQLATHRSDPKQFSRYPELFT